MELSYPAQNSTVRTTYDPFKFCNNNLITHTPFEHDNL